MWRSWIYQKLADRFPDTQFTGIEISPAVVETAKELTAGNDNIVIENADLWQYQPERLQDMVMMNNVIHYIDLEKRQALFTELATWLEKDGILSVVTPIAGSSEDPPFANVFNSFFLFFRQPLPPADQTGTGGMGRRSRTHHARHQNRHQRRQLVHRAVSKEKLKWSGQPQLEKSGSACSALTGIRRTNGVAIFAS
nr:class I SAM-dependent methyltransferase [Planococcus glaciei]